MADHKPNYFAFWRKTGNHLGKRIAHIEPRPHAPFPAFLSSVERHDFMAGGHKTLDHIDTHFSYLISGNLFHNPMTDIINFHDASTSCELAKSVWSPRMQS